MHNIQNGNIQTFILHVLQEDGSSLQYIAHKTHKCTHILTNYTHTCMHILPKSGHLRSMIQKDAQTYKTRNTHNACTCPTERQIMLHLHQKIKHPSLQCCTWIHKHTKRKPTKCKRTSVQLHVLLEDGSSLQDKLH